jgi:FixJ family two-component response regulator
MSDKTKIRIYIVDDDTSVCQALRMLFLSTDMEVQTFELAEEFLKCTPRENKACLITDIKMKGLGGFELQQKLVERGITIPVIFLTAFDSDENRKRAKQAGAVSYLQKPVDDQALLDTIHWALSSALC